MAGGVVKGTRLSLVHSHIRCQAHHRWNFDAHLYQFYIVPSILTSTALHLLSAYLTPSPRIRNFSLTAAASALSIIPYTLLVIMPTNKALLAMDEKNELTPAEESDVPYLLGKWNSLHGGRYLPYVVSWVAGLGGLMGVVGGW